MGRSSTPPDLEGHCPRCILRTEYCLCAQMPRVEASFRFVVLRHWSEEWRTSNTARLAQLAIPGTEMVTYGTREPLDTERWVPRDAWLLFPDGPARKELPGAGDTVMVLDGSWRQAKRMLHRLPALHTLRRISFAADLNVKRVRQPTVPNGMSTLEAMAQVVALVEGRDKAEPLHALYAALVERTLRVRGKMPPSQKARLSGR